MTPTPDEEVIAGVTKGVLDYSAEGIKRLAARLLHRDLAFIEDRDSFEAVADQKRHPEWSFFKEYVKDRDLRVLIRIGLALRKLEGREADLQSLRKHTRHKYGLKGLYVAQLVQDGDLGPFITTLLSKEMSKADLGAALEQLLSNVEKYVIFIQGDIQLERKILSVSGRINTLLPSAILICGSRGAKRNAEKVAKGVMRRIDGYELSKYEDKVKAVYLIMKDESPDED